MAPSKCENTDVSVLPTRCWTSLPMTGRCTKEVSITDKTEHKISHKSFLRLRNAYMAAVLLLLVPSRLGLMGGSINSLLIFAV